MNRFLTFCVFATLAGSFHNATERRLKRTWQKAGPHSGAVRTGPRTAAKQVVTTRMAPRFIALPAEVPAQRFNSNLSRALTQPATNVRPNYSTGVGILNPNVAVLNGQPGVPAQQPITIDPMTRQTELRTLAAMRERRGFAAEHANAIDPVTRNTESRTLQKMREHREFGADNQTLATINPQRNVTTRDPEAGPQLEKHESSKDTHGKKWHNKKDRISYDEAFRRHWHESHDRNWWHDHCDTIVFVTTGYYFLDGSYWYPAYGYDPLQTYYDYDGPIYTYSNLLPDEVIANVQTALQDAGYYFGDITGSLGVDTRAAIANFQRDYGLSITGAIDEATVEALGLY